MGNSCVYIGGFAGSEKARDRIVEALRRRNYSPVIGYTLSYATNHPDLVRGAVQAADTIFTHSAGVIVALSNASSSQVIHSIAPPIPRRLRDLSFIRSLQETGWTQQSHHATEKARRLGAHNFEAATELMKHPLTNLRYALRISRFNVLDPAVNARLAGTAFMEHDAYFIPGPEFDAILPHTRNVVTLKGEHDELQLDPDAVLEEYFSKLVGEKKKPVSRTDS